MYIWSASFFHDAQKTWKIYSLTETILFCFANSDCCDLWKKINFEGKHFYGSTNPPHKETLKNESEVEKIKKWTPYGWHFYNYVQMYNRAVKWEYQLKSIRKNCEQDFLLLFKNLISFLFKQRSVHQFFIYNVLPCEIVQIKRVMKKLISPIYLICFHNEEKLKQNFLRNDSSLVDFLAFVFRMLFRSESSGTKI